MCSTYLHADNTENEFVVCLENAFINSRNSCPGYNVSLVTWVRMIIYTIVVSNHRVCHGLDPR